MCTSKRASADTDEGQDRPGNLSARRSSPLHATRFRFGSDDINRRERQALARLARKLKPRQALLVTGHTDDIGPQPYNDALALRRAKAVAAVLIDAGLAGSRIRVLGRGKSAYRDTNETARGRAKNRRAEVRYQDETEEPAPRGGAGVGPKLRLVGGNGAEDAL